MTKYSDSEKIDLEILTDLYFFIIRIPVMSYVCLYRRMCASVAAERLDGFCSYSLLKSLFFLGRCSVNIVTCRMVRVTKITGSSSDDWIY
jgi:hypothetical protein